MKDKKLFITEDLQSICKVIDPNIDTVSYHKTYCYEVVSVYYTNGTKRIVNISGNSNGMVAIDVLKTVIHN